MKILTTLLRCLAGMGPPPSPHRYAEFDFVPQVKQTYRDKNGHVVTVMEIQPDWMCYCTSDGREFVRSRRGFCKQFKPVDQPASSL